MAGIIAPPPTPAGVEPGESYHWVIVTSDEYSISSSTSFPPPFGSINGLAGADWHVTLRAFNSGLLPSWDGIATPWTAILSDPNVDAVNRFTIAGQVYNTNGDKVADDSADFWDGSLDAAIQYDEFGVAVTTNEVWSGSVSFGTWEGESCGCWDDSSDTGWIGNASITGSPWLSSGSQNCSSTARLYGISPAITLPDSADFNGDDVVDGFDLLVLQRGFGLTGASATHANGDANGDDAIDDLDLAVWESQLGGPPPLMAAGLAAVALPEPSTLVLSLTGMMMALRTRRGRR